MEKYSRQELEDAIRRAFCDRRCDYIAIYDRRNRFLFESATLGVANGWLHEEFIEFDEQSSELRYRLTEVGKTHFGIKK